MGTVCQDFNIFLKHDSKTISKILNLCGTNLTNNRIGGWSFSIFFLLTKITFSSLAKVSLDIFLDWKQGFCDTNREPYTIINNETRKGFTWGAVYYPQQRLIHGSLSVVSESIKQRVPDHGFTEFEWNNEKARSWFPVDGEQV